MAEPVNPVIDGFQNPILGAGNTNANPLPVIVSETTPSGYKCFISRWRLTEKERKHIADGGDIWFVITNGYHPPIQFCFEAPTISPENEIIWPHPEDPLERLLGGDKK